MRIGVDVMGGDGGPDVVVSGAVDACQLLENSDVVVLVGDQAVIEKSLSNYGDYPADRIEIVHTDEVIGMAESPVTALRKKPNSSIAMLAGMHKAGKINACISAGNTGACVAAAQFGLGTLDCVHRPGIAITSPAFGHPVSVCDVGANINCRPQNLYQYAVMTSIYFGCAYGVDSPRVGLLSVGEEESKGNELVKGATDLLREDDSLNFVGNVESRDLLRGVCDVLICEGFVGNVVLKLIEGLGEDIVKYFMGQIARTAPDQADMFKGIVMEMKATYDFNDYGGAPLLGVDGISIICHGASTSRGIMNAVCNARKYSEHQVNEQITQRLGES